MTTAHKTFGAAFGAIAIGGVIGFPLLTAIGGLILLGAIIAGVSGH